MKPINRIFSSFALALGLFSTVSSANGSTSYTDYARVVHVEPVYHYVTVRKPQRICRHSPTANHHSRSNYPHQNRPRHNYRNNQHNRYQHNHHKRHSNGSVFVGALIGGAIGNELSRSVNGRSSTGATIAGAVIGSTLASAANNTHYNASSRNRHHANHNSHSSHNRYRRNHQYRNRHQHRNHQYYQHNHRQPHRQHCTTTNHTHKERQLQGYDVTYRYRGQEFRTHTSQHPGKRIAIQVSLAPHR
ncbi:hypothetical protein AB833_14640 [Chromatiales bacterium (ex Bugula neritina AB1)]|nr:hypothetical protein AB833_14640 [Chromatiales bacterium (ex Bugula neritina AB1)]